MYELMIKFQRILGLSLKKISPLLYKILLKMTVTFKMSAQLRKID